MIGATVIEKHFTLNKKLKGWDHSISADREELEIIVDGCKNIKKMLSIIKLILLRF